MIPALLQFCQIIIRLAPMRCWDESLFDAVRYITQSVKASISTQAVGGAVLDGLRGGGVRVGQRQQFGRAVAAVF